MADSCSHLLRTAIRIKFHERKPFEPRFEPRTVRTSYFFLLFSFLYLLPTLRVHPRQSVFSASHSSLIMIHSPFTQHLNRGSIPPPYLPSSFLLFSKTSYIGFPLTSPPSTNCLNIIEPRFEPPSARVKKTHLHPLVTFKTKIPPPNYRPSTFDL